MVLIQCFQVLIYISLVDLSRHQIHGACLYAATTVDASGFRVDLSESFVEYQNCTGTLNNAYVVIGDCTTHHRTTQDDLLGFALVAAAETDHFGQRSTDGSFHVLRIGNSITVNGDALGNQRHTSLQELFDLHDGGNVGDDHTNVSGQLTCDQVLTGGFVAQNTFCTLRILLLQFCNFQFRVTSKQFLELSDRIRLVGFDTNDLQPCSGGRQ